jgi:beta-glucuronidase
LRLPFTVRALVAAVVIALAATVAGGSGAAARGSGAAARATTYRPTTPTRGANTHDGWTDRYLLDGGWLYRQDRADAGVHRGFWRDTASAAGWTAVTVPNAYNAGDNSTPSFTGYVGWYRKDFRVPGGAATAQTQWLVRFESVNYRAEVWLNGHLIGSHAGAFLPFELELTHLNPGGVNRLIVRVDDRLGPGDLPPGPANPGLADETGGWWNYGGILGDVYLRPVREANLERVIVRPELPCPACAATIDAQAVVANVTGAPLNVALSGRFGSRSLHFGTKRLAPGATWTANAEIRLSHPDLWSPGHPALYPASVTLSDNHRALATYVTDSGIRSIKVTSDGLLKLNGRPLHLRGVGLQEASATTGGALSPPQIEQLIGWARDLGADLIRLQYPADPLLEELADRDGILLWSEIPVYQVEDQYLAQAKTIDLAHTMLADNILDNENHPSILLWSIGNELPVPAGPAQARYIAGATALAHRLDPTRPVGLAVKSWTGIGCQAAYAPLDVIGFNEYFGWYDEGDGGTADRAQLSPFLDGFRACYPHRAVMITEFGFEASSDGPVEDQGTYAFQTNSIAYHLSVFAQKPWLSGAVYWALQDFVCRPGWMGGNPFPDPPIFQKGLLDLQGQPKPAFDAVKQAYRTTVQIGPFTPTGVTPYPLRTGTAGASRARGSRRRR